MFFFVKNRSIIPWMWTVIWLWGFFYVFFNKYNNTLKYENMWVIIPSICTAIMILVVVVLIINNTFDVLHDKLYEHNIEYRNYYKIGK